MSDDTFPTAPEPFIAPAFPQAPASELTEEQRRAHEQAELDRQERERLASESNAGAFPVAQGDEAYPPKVPEEGKQEPGPPVQQPEPPPVEPEPPPISEKTKAEMEAGRAAVAKAVAAAEAAKKAS